MFNQQTLNNQNHNILKVANFMRQKCWLVKIWSKYGWLPRLHVISGQTFEFRHRVLWDLSSTDVRFSKNICCIDHYPILFFPGDHDLKKNIRTPNLKNMCHRPGDLFFSNNWSSFGTYRN